MSSSVSDVSRLESVMSRRQLRLFLAASNEVRKTLGQRQFHVSTQILRQNGRHNVFRRVAVRENANYAMIRSVNDKVVIYFGRNVYINDGDPTFLIMVLSYSGNRVMCSIGPNTYQGSLREMSALIFAEMSRA
jgi:hypothetical protein